MDKIETLYNGFVKDICKVFPEYKERLENTEDLNGRLTTFLKNLRYNISSISERDSKIFQNDPILLENISFKMMWNSNISSNTKKTIWKYLQTFCVLMINLDNGDKIQTVIEKIEAKEKLSKEEKKTVSEMKLLKKLNASIEENSIEEETNAGLEMDGMEEMGKMFESTGIGKIAKEITQDLNIEEMMKEGGGGIESIMNPNMMSKLFQSITTKMGSLEGEMNTEQLVSEASNICETMQGNPMFESIMGMQQSMMGQMNPGSTNKDISVRDTSHNSGKTRERLQKKLEQKKKEVVVTKQDSSE
jgi:hypothetical protein